MTRVSIKRLPDMSHGSPGLRPATRGKTIGIGEGAA
jgi:hypothetical protein